MKKRAPLVLASCVVGLSVLTSAFAADAQSLPPPVVDETEPTTSSLFAGTPDVLPGEIVVDLRDDLSDADIAKLGSELHVALRDNSPGVKDDGNIAVVDVDPSREGEISARLSRDPRVEAVEPMIVARALFTPNDPKYGEQWHMTRVGAERAWEFGCGEGVTVAVVDTGIACYDQSGFMKGTDLSGTACVDGYNFVGKNEIAADDQGHGTHVAGTIAQTTNNGVGVAGLSHCAKLMPVKVLSKQGWGTMADVAEGIRWAADHGAQVINLSLGAPVKSKVVENAVKHAYAKGVTVVAAAGNSGRSVGYPAAYHEAIAVSATDRNDNLAWFSSRGPEVTIAAPGVAVTQQTICDAGKNKCEQWGVFNGTSMASPHVAAAAALLVGQGITDPDAIRATLRATALPKEDANLFGAGILQADHAVVRAFTKHALIRLALVAAFFFLVARRIRQKGGSLEGGLGKWVGALFAGVGLLPMLPFLGLPARAGAHRWVAELAMKPFGEWDLILSPTLHKWLVLASAMPSFLLAAFFFSHKRLRPVVGGFAVGAAALSAQLALTGDTFFALGSFARTLFCAFNAVLCLWIARAALDAKRT